MRILLYDSGIGLIPLLRELIKEHRYHEYHLEMEVKQFPLGRLDPQNLRAYVQSRLEDWKNQNYEMVIVVCNTFSTALQALDLSVYPFRVVTILDANMAYLENHPEAFLLGTTITANYLQKRGYQTLDGSALVKAIEERDLLQLCHLIKDFKWPSHDLVLGCTHFSHIAFLLRRSNPHLHIIDRYGELSDSVPLGDHLLIFTDEKAAFWFSQFFLGILCR